MAFMQKPLDIVVLAAGRGSRLGADTPKPLMPLAEAPLLVHVLAGLDKLQPRRVVIVLPPACPQLRETAVAACPQATCVIQQRPRGTADAARCGVQKLAKNGAVLILCADTPLLAAAALRAMKKQAASGVLTLLCFQASKPQGYGRIVREGKKIVAIVEEKDAAGSQRQISEVFAGALAAPSAWLATALGKTRTRNASGEFYLTDLAALAHRENMPVAAVQTDEETAAGVNTMADLAAAETVLRRRRTAALMARGVRITDPARVDVRGRVRVGRNVEIDVNVILNGEVKLGRGCRIGAHCVISDCVLGEDVRVEAFCHLYGATIGARCVVGPFARLRPRTTLAAAARVGNFVEIKNSDLGAGVKAAHLSYLGDATVGRGANIGAGVITCNYDGKRKSRSIIGADAFIGSDVQLVAPVRVGRGAYIAAGTTLYKDAPAGQLTLSRTPQASHQRKKR